MGSERLHELERQCSDGEERGGYAVYGWVLLFQLIGCAIVAIWLSMSGEL